SRLLHTLPLGNSDLWASSPPNFLLALPSLASLISSSGNPSLPSHSPQDVVSMPAANVHGTLCPCHDAPLCALLAFPTGLGVLHCRLVPSSIQLSPSGDSSGESRPELPLTAHPPSRNQAPPRKPTKKRDALQVFHLVRGSDHHLPSRSTPTRLLEPDRRQNASHSDALHFLIQK
ncbi:hypothetical protein P7K49_024900, partial [Saguinus oedipus]